MAAKKRTREDLKVSLDAVGVDAAALFPLHVAKLDQLRSALATACMVIDELHDTTPYVPASPL